MSLCPARAPSENARTDTLLRLRWGVCTGIAWRNVTAKSSQIPCDSPTQRLDRRPSVLTCACAYAKEATGDMCQILCGEQEQHSIA